jgi:hypothetical protein
MGAKMVGCSRGQEALEGGYDITQEDVGVLRPCVSFNTGGGAVLGLEAYSSTAVVMLALILPRS